MSFSITTQQLPPDVSEEAKNVIAKMLAQNAYKRITAEQALKLPWIRQAEYVAPRAHLNETIVNLKKFNARRKFKVRLRNIIIYPTN